MGVCNETRDKNNKSKNRNIKSYLSNRTQDSETPINNNLLYLFINKYKYFILFKINGSM